MFFHSCVLPPRAATAQIDEKRACFSICFHKRGQLPSWWKQWSKKKNSSGNEIEKKYRFICSHMISIHCMVQTAWITKFGGLISLLFCYVMQWMSLYWKKVWWLLKLWSYKYVRRQYIVNSRTPNRNGKWTMHIGGGLWQTQSTGYCGCARACE